MKNTIQNRLLVANHFKGSEFKPAGPADANPEDTNHPFMLFGIGWGQMTAKIIVIQFDSERVKSHIEIEYSPCTRPSDYHYLDLTEDNIKLLPKTEKEYFDKFHPLVKRGKQTFQKQTS